MTDKQTDLKDRPPGSVLREARLSAGKSVTETAEALNLLKSYVEALECNDYSRFNSPLFARGYIKAYARYMQLDEAPLLKDCDRICQRDEERASRTRSQPGAVKAPGNSRLVVALVVAVLVWVVCVLIWGDGPQRKLEVTLLEQRPVAIKDIHQLPALGESLLKLSHVEPAPELPDVEAQQARVSLQFDENVWLEVRDVAGNVVLSGVQNAGQHLQLTVMGPVEISTSYWPAMTVVYNDLPVEFEKVVDSNAIRVRIGEI